MRCTEPVRPAGETETHQKGRSQMKKLLVLLAVVAAAAVLLLGGASNVEAAGNVVTVTGTITVTTTVSVDPATIALNLDTGDSKDVTVTETSNDTAGYTVTLTTASGVSSNAPTLALASHTSIPYAVTYSADGTGSAVTFTAGVATVTDVSDSSGSPATKIMRISAAAQTISDATAGAYTDTLTLAIDGK